MGANTSSNHHCEFEKARSCFSTIELAYFDRLFDRLALASKTQGGKANMLSWQGFEISLGKIFKKHYQKKIYDVFRLVQSRKKLDINSNAHDTVKLNGFVSHQSFICGLAEMIKGASDEKAAIFISLCERECGEDNIQLQLVTLLIEQLASAFLQVTNQSPVYALWRFDADSSLDALIEFYDNSLRQYIGKTGGKTDDAVVSRVLLGKWLCNYGLFLLEAMSVACLAVFNEILPAEFFTYPVIPTPVDYETTCSLLNFASLIIISDHISSFHANKSSYGSNAWRLVYNNIKHGESFTNFLKSITDEGPLLILIKEKHSDYIFGGFISTNVSPGPNFIGDDRCFLLSLAPRLRIYNTTGYDHNYAYFNAYQTTLPGGLGFGGRLTVDEKAVHFFALWLDEDFGKGKSQAGSCTYNNPQLSEKENFEIDRLEIWAVDRRPDIRKRRYSKSVLDTNPELKAILAMTGKGPASEGLRDEDDTADIPEERRLSNM